MRGFLVRRPNATPRVFRSDLQLVNPLVEECRFGATLLRRSAFSFSPRPKVGAIFLLITYRYTLFMPNNSTSWGKVAAWYDDLLDGDDTYQKKVILPNLKRLAGIQKGDQVLDLGCGQGFFAREFAKAGGRVTGVDLASDLIDLAKKNSGAAIEYRVAPADQLNFLKNGGADKIFIILALQNMENAGAVIKECRRVIKPSGKIHLVLNHPAFRIPKASGWGWDERRGIQYRRIDGYLSESKEKIQMHPGNAPKDHTFSFHRPLQFYAKVLGNNGFAVTRLEEWESHRRSQPGARAASENRARREIPLFLYIEAVAL